MCSSPATGRGLGARDTPILAFPHKGGRDPLTALGASAGGSYRLRRLIEVVHENDVQAGLG